ncbi:MAG: ATP-dependent endonuclease [Actinobacteria bacterium HGW-Actinobacteria-2]|nr:MAG: ATP-dependent endonuclease [Actinobacteria bacterium HGW-Actinobacteria-2]
MITRVIVQNYRCLRHLDFVPLDGMNIVVGDNEAGKSTLLEALGLVLTGRVNGRRPGEEINPFWFNTEAVAEYFTAIAGGDKLEPPQILIEVYFAKDDQPQTLRGKVNSRHEDCPGLRLVIELDPDFEPEFDQYLRSSHPPVLPAEYFRARWLDFRELQLQRRPPEFGVAFIDGRTVRSSSGVDNHTRQMLADAVDKRDGAAISVAFRQSRHELTQSVLAGVNQKIRTMTQGLLTGQIELHLDQSASSGWEAAVIPQVGSVPFAMAGQGQQVIMKTALALQATSGKTSFVLVEEPENHLSHTGLMSVIASIEKLAGGRQTFVVTHSSYVMNRLGLDRIHLMHQGKVKEFRGLDAETVSYFKKQSGYDTLRVVLARKVVIVEGPSDEMIFNRAYKDQTGQDPVDDGIDVLTYGTQNRRPLELCHLLDRRVAILRDVDKRTPQHWKDQAKPYLEDGVREMFVGDPGEGSTLEPQLVSANNADLATLGTIVGCPDGEDLTDHLTDNKTESAWRIATSARQIKYPGYITKAITFIRK